MRTKHIVLTEVRLRTKEERVSYVRAICPNTIDRIQSQEIIELRAHIPKKKKFNKSQFYIDDGTVVVVI